MTLNADDPSAFEIASVILSSQNDRVDSWRRNNGALGRWRKPSTACAWPGGREASRGGKEEGRRGGDMIAIGMTQGHGWSGVGAAVENLRTPWKQ
jgi:hypothetical protein